MKRPYLLLSSLLIHCLGASAAPPQPAAPAGLAQALQRQEYFASVNHTGLQAPNRAQGLRTYFQADGLHVVRRDTEETLLFDWRVRRLERGDGAIPLAAGVPQAQGAQVVLQQGALRQTFDNRADGLQWSLRLEAPPRGSGRLRVRIDLGGARLGQGGGPRLVAADGTLLNLVALKAVDADGRDLALTADAASGGLLLSIDDTAAVLPIRVETLVSKAFDVRAESNQVAAHFAASVAAVGDINLDGIGDFAVGAPEWDGGETDEGAVFVYYGNSAWTQGLWIVPADRRLESNQSGARLGTSVAAAGDYNRDNVMDIVAGAPLWNNGNNNEGAAFVYSGLEILLNDPVQPAARLEADRSNAQMGASVAGAGDTDGDGYDDILVGAPGFQLGTTLGGRAFLFRGGPAAAIDPTPDVVYSSSIADERLGASVAGAGDTNGDGRTDVLVGAPGGSYVELHRGGSAAPQDSVRLDVNNLPMGDPVSFGTALAGVGDVNGDGYGDFVVGQPEYSSGQSAEGGVFLYFGGIPFNTGVDAILQADQAGAGFGSSVAGAGDINGDGYGDLVVGAPHYSEGENSEGRVLVYLGRPGAFPATAATALQIDQAGAVFGSSVALGDVDGDGYADVIAGAPYADYGHSDEGAAFVYQGGAGNMELNADASLAAPAGQSADGFGISVDGAGDVNRDGYDDIIVGAPGYDGGETDEGRAFVFTGSAGGLSTTPFRIFEENQAGAGFGQSVAGAGDVNGDGFADVIVGAPRFDQGETDEGTAFVYLGAAAMNTVADARYEGNAANALQGWSVAGANDVNGDGYADLVVGAPNHGLGRNGSARVYLGGNTQLATDPAAELPGPMMDSRFGSAVAGAGDVNGDGYGDIVVGAPNLDVTLAGAAAPFVGRVSLYLGGRGNFDTQADLQLFGDQAGARFGYSVAGAGDTDGDGFDDVVIGAPTATKTDVLEAGKAFVHFGAAAAALTRSVLLNSSTQYKAQLGMSVDSAGDVNRDGYADVVVGAPYFDLASNESGIAYVFYGGASGFASPSYVTQNLAGGNLGRAVAGAGDTNGDGFADIVAGTPFEQTAVLQPGRAQIHFGGAQGGRDLRLQQLLDGVLPIAPWGPAGDHLTIFTVSAQAASPNGRERVRLLAQICPSGTNFFSAAAGCRSVENTSWTDTGLGGVTQSVELGPLNRGMLYHWRARLAYAPPTAHLTNTAAAPRRYGPWLYFRAQSDSGDVRIMSLPDDTIFADGFE